MQLHCEEHESSEVTVAEGTWSIPMNPSSVQPGRHLSECFQFKDYTGCTGHSITWCVGFLDICDITAYEGSCSPIKSHYSQMEEKHAFCWDEEVIDHSIPYTSDLSEDSIKC